MDLLISYSFIGGCPEIYIPAIYIPEIRIPENNFPIIFILFKISLKRRKLRVGEQYCERKRDA